MSIRNSKIRRSQRKDEAEKRNQVWKQLTPKQQLALLDTRLGKGIGATKQRKRLQAQIQSPKPRRENKTREETVNQK